MPVLVKPYTSPTLVLLAFDWPDGDKRSDFLGFAIQRTPGFAPEAQSWLPNRISWEGPIEGQPYIPSNVAPIQKFYWWDAHIDTADRGSQFEYRVIPVVGPWNNLQLLHSEATPITLRINKEEELGITTYFNRAVVSSQSFSKEFPDISTPEKKKAARAWLANGMENAVPRFITQAEGKSIEGAIYHLSDKIWIIPALTKFSGSVSLAYNHTSGDHTSDDAIQTLAAAGQPEENFKQRTHANIMHNKFLVRVGPHGNAEAVLAGSANFTSEGLSAQANLLHAFESEKLATLYLARKRLLDGDPTLSKTQKEQIGWSDPIEVGDATIQAYFPPENKNTRVALDEIVNAVKQAKHSILLCAYDPTDKDLLDAVIEAANAGKMVLGLVNRVPEEEPTGDPNRADVGAKIEIFNWYEKDHSVVGFSAFKSSDAPTEFYPERVLWPGENPKIMVRVHHKFVVIDAEGGDPVIFTGSANFSGNSLHNNDENQLKITKCSRLAGMYMAEFLRLYEHYRARMQYERRKAGNTEVFKLAKDNSWNKKYFTAGTPETKATTAMAGE